MCKYFVTIINNDLDYRLSKQDIRQIHSVRKRRLPALPPFQKAPRNQPEFAQYPPKQEMATQDFEEESSQMRLDNQ